MKALRVRVKDGNRELEVEGDKNYIDYMLKRFAFIGFQKSQHDSLEEKEEPKAAVHAKLSAKTSPAEFVHQNQIKKHTNLVLGFGYYLEKLRGMDKFSPGDINDCYYDAKLDPSNTSQMIIQNIKAGFLMGAKGSGKGAGGKKYYRLTQSGIDYVEKGFKRAKT